MKIKDILIFWKIWNFFVTCISLKMAFLCLKKTPIFVKKLTGFRFFEITKKSVRLKPVQQPYLEDDYF